MPSQKPNLLTIPSEIRLQTLQYTLQETDRDYYDIPNAISVYWPRAFPNPEKYKPPFYGTAAMSKLFTVNRQLHDELEELLYTQFVFVFSHYLRVDSARDFIDPLNVRVKGLLREIMVPINVNLGFNHAEEVLTAANTQHARQTREAFEYMRDTLPGLKRVQIYIIFVGGPLGGRMMQRRVDEFAKSIMDLVAIFAANSEVVILLRQKDRQQCRVEIMKVCQERLQELKSH